jgi:hypothetical protein
MKKVLDRETMPDELYNILLQTFVNQALTLGFNVTGTTEFNDWKIECEVKQPVH